MNLDSEAVLVLAAHCSGEQLSAGDDEPEHVVQGLEALPDGVLPLRARHHVRAVPHAAQQTLQPITAQYCQALTNHRSVLPSSDQSDHSIANCNKSQPYLVDERGGELLRDVGLYNGLEPFELRLPRGGEDVDQGVEHLTNHSSVLPHTDQSQLSIVTH